VVTPVLATLQNFNHNRVKASLSLGAGPLETFFHVTLPVIAPGVISGALFAFATSFDEVVVTLFLAGPDQVTLPRQMFTGIRENIWPTIAAVATLLILFTTALMLTPEWLRGRRKQPGARHNPPPKICRRQSEENWSPAMSRPRAIPTVQISNERAIVTEWRFPPSAETGWHPPCPRLRGGADDRWRAVAGNGKM
jgi:hypothetical protein